MELYRLAVNKFADLSGIGGIYGSARWHHAGAPILYAASSRSLAVLERFIHEHNISNISLMMMTIYIPDDCLITSLTHRQLPNGWDTTNKAKHDKTQTIGSKFLKENKYAALEVPSAIVPHEYNYLLNPLHADAKTFTLIASHPYYYDARHNKFIGNNTIEKSPQG